ncbi:MAG TPA: heme exporter protein CcmB [Aggregatilineales bacterium]|nr:heme exporter protein CcmB [Anaerolineales bacterium]HRE48640.1 heme exporter protein CcmB [Aggregatilineales bacterium]
MIRAAWQIAAKDLRAEFRTRSLITAMSLFGVLTTMVFYYTFEARPDARRAAIPAVLWVTVVFASTVGIGRSLAQEADKGTLDGLLLSPIPRPALYFGKLITAWLFTGVVAAVVSLALLFLFNANLFHLGWWVMILIGTLGFAAVGTLLGSMAIYARTRETTLPIIVLPIALPVIIAAVNASSAIVEGLPFSSWASWAIMLASLDGLFLLAAYGLFAYIVEE